MIKYDYARTKFFITADDMKGLPLSSMEIAIAGRSNAGKSSLLNKLTNQNRLAYTSKTPGRTQHINYFALPEREDLFLVDLPGYGYAKVPDKIRNHWEKLLGQYLQTRKEILGLVLIMDSRHPLKELDYKMLDFFGSTGKPIHIVLSKVDKLTIQEKNKTIQTVKAALTEGGYKNFSIQLFSCPKNVGIEELQQTLNGWINNQITQEII